MDDSQTAIRIWFTDCSREYTPESLPTHPLYRQLAAHLPIKPDPLNPDVIFYTSYGVKFRHYKCLRVFFTLENDRPDPMLHDFSLTFDSDIPGHNLRFPFAWRVDLDELILLPRPAAQPKKRFCNFIYSNPHCTERNDFFHLLSAYRRVDAAGQLFNNTPFSSPRSSQGFREEKIAFQRAYKFTIAFENQSVPGYTTEKLADALLARTVPIYWGNPEVAKDFDPRSFINCHDFPNYAAVIQHIKAVDRDDALYQSYLNAPAWPAHLPSSKVSRDRVLAEVAQFLRQPPSSRASRSIISRLLARLPTTYAQRLIRHRQRWLSKKLNVASRY